jgi:pyruvate dehydrogenase E1 component
METLARQVFVSPTDTKTLETLESIQRRLLWLATYMIHYANHIRPNPDGTKVGGHQASSASVVSILTALYFHFLQPGDRISIKPHASPVLHAIQYLLGQLPREYLMTLRAYKGLQAYPSRTKDPDRVDFSTGSVGFGAVAPVFAALAHKYASAHFGAVTSRHFIALVGDAELDEGNVWEAVLDESTEKLDNLFWIVDLNRQSLDRVVPGIRAARLKHLFLDHGWRVFEAKYGRRLQELFAQPGGEALRRCIDEMSNEEYQSLLRIPGDQLRRRLAQNNPALESIIQNVPDEELGSVLANLGGHDLAVLIDVFGQAMQSHGHPVIIFCYTVKGWGLPIAGDPLNHSKLLSAEQIESLREQLGIAPGSEWDIFDENSNEGQLCKEVAHSLYTLAEPARDLAPTIVPESLPGVSYDNLISSQETFGRLLYRIAEIPELCQRIVTSSPDVSISTNLAGWINKVGAFKLAEVTDYEGDAQRLLKWSWGLKGQHIELGISEMNLFVLLGMFGLAAELCGQLTIPIGTVYDPFVCRGLDALIYALYSGSKFIFAGTPSGISLAPEGGAHQSSITSSIGVELPRLQMYEPCFAREVEWVLLEAIRECFDRKHGRASYLRLTTKPIDQRLLDPVLHRLGETRLRQQVLAGGYRLRDWHDAGPQVDNRYIVQIATSGALIPEACTAAAMLWEEGVAANVLNITGARRLFETWRAQHPLAFPTPLFDWLILPSERRAPIVTVQDASSHSIAWLGSIFGVPGCALGVDAFGQSGTRDDLYRHYQVDAQSIVSAAFSLLDVTLA